ncbi:hypothetical protein EGM51_13315 [Verrucomicrobia bacterium S94]|nr:hypothetical protein EGM51_13315 [Verrucomicrobia bacterium S94]
MALIKCPECKSKVSDKADSCPTCGFNISSYTPPVKPEKRELTPEEQKKANKGCLIGIVVLLILAAIGSLIPDEDKKSSSSSPNNSGLTLQAMKVVRHQLQDYGNANFIMSSIQTTKVSDKYYVIGEFDSKNAFGAKVRSTFAVEFIKNSGSGYKATHVQIK